MAKDTEIYSGEKMDVCQPDHEGRNIKESYMSRGDSLLAEVSHGELIFLAHHERPLLTDLSIDNF